jgi:hypothetical protein
MLRYDGLASQGRQQEEFLDLLIPRLEVCDDVQGSQYSV